MKTDIEIAQSIEMRPIGEIAKAAGIPEKYLEQYGRYKAKVDLSLLKEMPERKSKLILVTAITPTPAGEGKTTTTIGLADGLHRIGKNVIAALREPSLGPVFAVKGGAAVGAEHGGRVGHFGAAKGAFHSVPPNESQLLYRRGFLSVCWLEAI